MENRLSNFQKRLDERNSKVASNSNANQTVEVTARENSKKSKARIVQSLRNLECRPSEVVQEVLNPSVHEEAHQTENQDVEIYESISVNGNHEASVESLEGKWNDATYPSKPIQEIDTVIVGDSIIKDIKPSLMSASNKIRKKCLRVAKVEECTFKVDFSAYKCKKAVVIHLGTNNITTDDSPKIIASKLAEEGTAKPPKSKNKEFTRRSFVSIVSSCFFFFSICLGLQYTVVVFFDRVTCLKHCSSYRGKNDTEGRIAVNVCEGNPWKIDFGSI